MEINPADLSLENRYKLLIGMVVPRPIAFVSTISPEGRPNLAPFSFFNGVSSAPLILAFAPANKPDGTEKDTLRNAKPASEGGTGECVIHLVSESFATKMAACAEPLAYGESEFALSGLSMTPSRMVRPPRVAEALVAFECRTRSVLRFAPGAPSGGNLVLAEVVHIHAAEGLVNERYHVDAERLAAIGRMGGPTYCRTRERFDIPMGREALRVADPLAGP